MGAHSPQHHSQHDEAHLVSLAPCAHLNGALSGHQVSRYLTDWRYICATDPGVHCGQILCVEVHMESLPPV